MMRDAGVQRRGARYENLASEEKNPARLTFTAQVTPVGIERECERALDAFFPVLFFIFLFFICWR